MSQKIGLKRKIISMIYNFSRFAIDDILAQAKICDDVNEPYSSNIYKLIANLLEKEAIKFALPDGGRLFESNKPFSPSDADLLHLPYPVIALEYSMEGNHPATISMEEMSCQATKRICLAIDDPDSDGITVIPMWFNEKIKKWVVSISCAFIPRKQDHSPESLLYFSGIEGKTSNLKLYIKPLIAEAWDRCVNAKGQQGAMRLGLIDAKDEINSLLSFLLILSCTNVKTRDSEDEQILRKVNAKRINKGKKPIFSYKILEIIVPKETLQSQFFEKQDPCRRSPRIHLRRGHVRRIDDGKRVWVNACVVGKKDEGYIYKDYKLLPVPQN